MKSGVVLREFRPERGCIQTYVFELTRELARRGHYVTLFTTPHTVGELNSTPFRTEAVLKLRRKIRSPSSTILGNE